MDQRWLWRPGWIPRGRLSMITGPTGSEKSMVATWIASELLRDREQLSECAGGHRIAGPSRQIMWLDGVDGYQRLLDRLRALKTPPGIFWPIETPQQDFPVLDMTQDHWLQLVASVAVKRQPYWMVVDGIAPRGGEMPPGLERALEAMAKLALDLGCAITLLVDLADRPTRGWLAIAGRAATVMQLKPSGLATREAVFRVIKTDFGDPPAPLWLRLDGALPEVVSGPPSSPPPATALDRAATFIKEQLACGPRPAIELTEEARKHRIAPRTLQRAKQEAEVTTYCADGRWWWILV